MSKEAPEITLTLTQAAKLNFRELGISVHGNKAKVKSVSNDGKSAIVSIGDAVGKVEIEGEAAPYVGEIIQLNADGVLTYKPTIPVTSRGNNSSPSVPEGRRLSQ